MNNKIFFLVLIVSFTGNLMACESDSISQIRVVEDNIDYLDIEVDYCLSETTGRVKIRAVLERDGQRLYDRYKPVSLSPGKGTTVLAVERGFTNYKKFESTHIKVDLFKERNKQKKSLITTSFPYDKEWPAIELDDLFLDSLIEHSVKLIDSGKSKNFVKAKQFLDDVLNVNAKKVDAYPELARYYMKTQGFGVRSQGVLMAEQTLLTGLGIDKNHSNSRVLLGYVYVWEERFEKAKEEFEKAESLSTENTWLYTNWGQMYEKQNKLESAVKYYQKAALRKPKNNTYDRAITEASRNLFNVYLKLEDYESARSIASKTFGKFPSYKCYQARMHLVDALYLDRYEDVILEIEKQELGCHRIYKEVKALAYLRKWSNVKSKNLNSSDSSYIKAMNIYPDYVELIIELAKYDFAADILNKLKETRGLEVKDANGLTPIVRSIVENKSVSVKNLIKSGADIDVKVGPDQLTPLMLAVVSRNNDMVESLIIGGANRSKKSINGMTALDIANHFKFQEIIETINKTNGI